MITIDVILRTRNRAALLRDAVASFFAADHSGIAARLLVVDNASSDQTPAILAELEQQHGPKFVALYEAKAGGQHALNRGLSVATAEIVAFYDDDERLADGWLQVIRREFADARTDYIAGPVRPAGNVALPSWLPGGFGGVLGIIDSGPDRRRFAPGFGAMLTQGNCALRRRIFIEVGPYPAALPTAEDRWLNQWLEAAGKQGFYCPDFAVTHIMQPERIRPAYFRRWAAREGRDLAMCDGIAGKRSPFTRPWYWRHLLHSAGVWMNPRARRADRFAGELNLRVAWNYLRAIISRTPYA